jgi:hypothetical protein
MLRDLLKLAPWFVLLTAWAVAGVWSVAWLVSR